MIIADTGYWYALMNRRDEHHQAAVRASQLYMKEKMITTSPVLTEVCHLLLDRIGNHAQVAFLAGIAESSTLVHPLSKANLEKASLLMTRYADLPMDFADAPSSSSPKSSATAASSALTNATSTPTAGRTTNPFKTY